MDSESIEATAQAQVCHTLLLNTSTLRQTHLKRISRLAHAGDWWSRFWIPCCPPNSSYQNNCYCFLIQFSIQLRDPTAPSLSTLHCGWPQRYSSPLGPRTLVSFHSRQLDSCASVCPLLCEPSRPSPAPECWCRYECVGWGWG